MFMVGGGILTHGFAPAHHFIQHIASSVGVLPMMGGFVQAIVPMLLDAVAGVLAGAILVMAGFALSRLLKIASK